MFFGRPRMAMDAPMPAMGPAPGMPGTPGMPGAPGMYTHPGVAPYPAPVVGPSGVLNMDIGGPELMAPVGPYAEEHGMVHAMAPRVHVVVKGDTVWKLARQYNISTQAIIQANNLRYPDVLYPGERLIIPDGLHYSNY